jgi:hypothetical protein
MKKIMEFFKSKKVQKRLAWAGGIGAVLFILGKLLTAKKTDGETDFSYEEAPEDFESETSV